MSLVRRLARIAFDHPEMRPSLMPVLRSAAEKGGKKAKDLPPDVERYVQEGKDQGLSESAAWGVAWSRYCVTGDTYVNTSMGMLTVAEVAARAVARKVVHSDGVVAQEIVTDIATHEGTSHTSHVINTGIKPVVKVRTKHGYTLICTPDHQLLVLNTDDYSTEWVDAGDCGGRYLVLPTHGVCGTRTVLPTLNYEQRVWNNVIPLHPPKEMSRDLARVLGYLVSEGSITEEGTEFSNTDLRVVADYTRCMIAVFGEEPKTEWANPNPAHRRKTRCAKVRSRTRWYREFFAALGMNPGRAQDKEVPHVILGAPQKFVVEFLRAFMEGDGYVGDKNHMNRVDLSTSSEKLARQLHLLLANLGVLGTLEQNRRGYFNVRIHSEPMVRRFVGAVGNGLFKRVALTENRQRQRGSEFECIPAAGIMALHKAIASRLPGTRRVSLPRLLRHWDVLETHAGGHPVLSNLRDLLDRGYLFDPASVGDAGEAEVFDLTVPGDSSFVANGLVVHNCEYKNPDSPHCKQDNYFPGRAAMRPKTAVDLPSEERGGKASHDDDFKAGYAAGKAAYKKNDQISSSDGKKAYKRVSRKYGSWWEDGYNAAIEVSRGTNVGPGVQIAKKLKLATFPSLLRRTAALAGEDAGMRPILVPLLREATNTEK